MALELRQQLRLSQQLIMTPQLQQAIKLLQLSRLELLDTIHQELETNPLLEESQEELPTEQDAELETLTTEETPFQEVQLSEKMREDFDWEGYLEEYNTSTPVLVEIDPNQEWPSFDSRLTEPTTLEDHLVWQLRLSDFSDEEREIGACIIGNLNNDGYLDATIEDIVEMSGAEPSKVEEVLGRIQNFDPTGVAARDLRECLLVQAKNMEFEDKLVVRIIEDHLQLSRNKELRRTRSRPQAQSRRCEGGGRNNTRAGSQAGKRLQQRDRRIHQSRHLRLQG